MDYRLPNPLVQRGSSTGILSGRMSGISDGMLKSADWKFRTDEYPYVLNKPHGMPPGWTSSTLVTNRMCYFSTTTPINSELEMDRGYVRYSCEETYIGKLARADGEWVRTVVPEGVVKSALLLCDGPRILNRIPPAMSGIVNLHVAVRHMLMSWRHF